MKICYPRTARLNGYHVRARASHFLHEWRIGCGLSKSALVQTLGVSYTTYHGWEQGDSLLGSLHIWERLHALGCTIPPALVSARIRSAITARHPELASSPAEQRAEFQPGRSCKDAFPPGTLCASAAHCPDQRCDQRPPGVQSTFFNFIPAAASLRWNPRIENESNRER